MQFILALVICLCVATALNDEEKKTKDGHDYGNQIEKYINNRGIGEQSKPENNQDFSKNRKPRN